MANLAEVLYITGAATGSKALQAPLKVSQIRAQVRQSKKKQTDSNHGNGSDQYTLNSNNHVFGNYPTA